MIPPVLFHNAAKRAGAEAAKAAGDAGPGSVYAARFGILMAFLALLGAVFAISWTGGIPSRRRAVPALQAHEIEPLIQNALRDVGAGPQARVVTDQTETRFWKRRFDETAAIAIVPLEREQIGPFLRAVGESLEARLTARNGTLRNVTGTAWPDSLHPARPTGPARLSMPYATRGRVGWVVAQAQESEIGLTLFLTHHEGPKPTD